MSRPNLSSDAVAMASETVEESRGGLVACEFCPRLVREQAAEELHGRVWCGSCACACSDCREDRAETAWVDAWEARGE